MPIHNTECVKHDNYLHKKEVFPQFLNSFFTFENSFSTQVQEFSNGRESRRSNRSIPITRYFLPRCNIKRSNFKELLTFFYDKVGKLYSFLFFDINNFQALDQELIQDSCLPGQGRYFLTQSLSRSFFQEKEERIYRVIKTPIIETVSLYKISPEGLRVKFEEYKYNPEEGCFYIEENIEKIRASFKFFVPVRFDQDSLQYKCSASSDYIILENLFLREIIL